MMETALLNLEQLWEICDNCGTKLIPRKCKLICEKCGFFRDCSEP